MPNLMTASFLLAAATSAPADAPTGQWDETRVADAEAWGNIDTTPREDPEESRTWHYEGFYVATGVSPGTTFHLDGINPMLRYDFEIGMHWQRKKWDIAFGADAWLLQYYERDKVGGGLHGVVTVTRRPVYMRFGAGSLTGIPGSRDDADFRPAVGALAGIGLEGGGEHLKGRFGVDYHVSLDKAGRVNNTVLLALRFKF